MDDGSKYFVFKQLDIQAQMSNDEPVHEDRADILLRLSQESLKVKSDGKRQGVVLFGENEEIDFCLPTPMRRHDDPYLGMRDPDIAGRRAGILGNGEIFSVTGQVYEALARGVLLLRDDGDVSSNPHYDPMRDPDSPLFSRQLYSSEGPLSMRETSLAQQYLAGMVFEHMPLPFSPPKLSPNDTVEPEKQNTAWRRRKTDHP